MWLSTKHSSVEMKGCSAEVNVLLPQMTKMVYSREKEMVHRILDKIDHTGCYDVYELAKLARWLENGGLPAKTTKSVKRLTLHLGYGLIGLHTLISFQVHV